MLVISWNIKVNRRDVINKVADKLRNSIALSNGDVFLNGPWVLGILESKDGPDVRDHTVNELKQAFGADWGYAAPAGGGIHTSENVLLIGKGCSLMEDPYMVEEWKIGFDQYFDEKVQNFKAQATDPNRRASQRQHVAAATVASYNAVDAWNANNCRNPIYLRVREGQNIYRLAFVHSPGPSEYSFAAKGVKYAKKYLEVLLPCLTSPMYQVDLLIGDFNIHGSDPDSLHGLQRIPSEATTLALDGKPSSPLDRAYIGVNYTSPMNVFIYPCTREVSDHMGIGVKLLKEQAMSQAASDNNVSLNLYNQITYNMPNMEYAHAHKKQLQGDDSGGPKKKTKYS